MKISGVLKREALAVASTQALKNIACYHRQSESELDMDVDMDKDTLSLILHWPVSD
jgi:hypothetical protein